MDLGCGDERRVISAARSRLVLVWISIPSSLCSAGANAVELLLLPTRSSLSCRIFFKRIFWAVFGCHVYLLPDVNLKLRPNSPSVTPGTRIVSHNYDMNECRRTISRKSGFMSLYSSGCPGQCCWDMARAIF